jgi:hypothetical protein
VADRYYVGASGTTWNSSSTAVWSTTSGGAPGASVPTAADNVFFTLTGLRTITVSGTLACLNITASAGTHTFIGTATLNVSGSMSFTSNTRWNATGSIVFNATTSQTITRNGSLMNNISSVTFNGVGGAWTLGSAFTVGSGTTVILTNGTLNLGAFTLTAGAFSSANSNTRRVSFIGGGNITLVGTGVVWDTNPSTNLTTTGSSTVNVSNSGASAISVDSGALSSVNSFSFNFTTGSYALTLAAGTKNNLNFSGFSGTVNNSAQTIHGSLNLGSTATFTAGTSAWTFGSVGTKPITSNGKTMDFPIIIDSVGAFVFQLVDAMTIGSTRTLTHTNGTLNLNGRTLTVGSYTTAAGTKDLTFNGGTLVVVDASASAFNNAAPTGFTTTAGTGTGTISLTAATDKGFVGGGSTFNCTLNQGGAGALTVTGANTFNNITNTVQPASVLFTAGTTNTFNSFSLSGTPGNLITLASATAATHTLSKATGTVSVNYLSITNSTATGGAIWDAGLDSINGGGNTGWIFAAPAAAGAFFSIL